MMKLNVIIPVFMVFYPFYYLSAQETIFEEGATTQNTESRGNDLKRFSNVDDCEDTCENECEMTCKDRCGGNEQCEDDCKDTCEDRCQKDCSVLKPSYGPQKGAVLFFSSLNVMLHHSRISEEEDRFLDETDMHMIYSKNNQPVDTVLLEYMYRSVSGNVGVQYYLNDLIGIGLLYEFMQTDQVIDNNYENSSGALINSNALSAMLTGYVLQKKRIGLSFAVSFGALWGGLYRFPLMYKDAEEEIINFTTAEKEYVNAIHERVFISGCQLSLSSNFNFMINRFLMVYGGPRYSFRQFALKDDQFDGYPRTSNSHDFGINVNFGVMINGKNSH